jgi:ATP-dependent protease Clp ATPase subunit
MMLKLRYIGICLGDYPLMLDRLLSACDWSPKVAETGIVVLDEVLSISPLISNSGR